MIGFYKRGKSASVGEKSHRKTSSEPNTACAGSLPPPFRDQPAEVIQLAEDSSGVRKLRSD
jgi:hypothetical protein